MPEYKANKKYFDLGEKKDFRSISGHSKHGLLVSGHKITLDTIPAGMEDCLDDINAKTKKKKKKESK
jgi:hypothetical protein